MQILTAEQQLTDMLDRVYRKYESQLEEKRKIKEQLIRRIKEQESLAEENYNKNVREERENFELLEKQAQATLARNKLGVIQERVNIVLGRMS